MGVTSKKPPAGKGLPDESERLRRVLIAVDLTAITDRVLRRISHLPLARGASISVLHVVPESLPAAAQARATRDARKLLRSEIKGLRSHLPRGMLVEAHVKVGNGPREIAAAARACQAELIVMGRGGPRALRDSFLGSTAERVIRAARLPVLAVRLSARTPYLRPALAVAFDRAAASAVTMARRLLGPASERLAVIHAIDSANHGLVYPSLARDSDRNIDAELELRTAQKIAALFAPAQLPAGAAPSRWKPLVRVGSARIVIPKVVKHAEADLLVLGTSGRAGIAQVLLGTVAGDVLREVRCDVLLVPPQRSKKASKREA